MKSIGIIGGIAPASTIGYHRLIVSGYRERTNDGSHPSVVINRIDMTRMLRLIGAGALDGCIEVDVGGAVIDVARGELL